MNFAAMIFHHARTHPQKPAIILPDRVVTYEMMAQGILSVTDRLSALRLEPGSLVSVAIASPIRHLIVAAALFRMGLPRLSVELTSRLSVPGLPVALYLEGSSGTLIPGLNQVLVDDDWFGGPAQRLAATPQGFPSDDAICAVALSSGTTGRPKAISYSVRAAHHMILNAYFSMDQGCWNRVLCLPGLYTNWGFTVAAHALYTGKTMCFAYTPLQTLQTIAVHNVDCLVASTQHLRELSGSQRDNPVPCPSLRSIVVSGSGFSRALLSEIRASLCSNVTVLYGSSEAGSTALAPADQLMAVEGAAGILVPWAEVQIVDSEDRLLPANTEGALRVRTSAQGQPYPPGADSEGGFRDGWFYPGDLGRVTEDGLLVLTGRQSEIINAGGIKLAPDLIEDIVRRHPAIADVAALPGIAADGVEQVWLAIVARTPVDAQELIRFCAAKNIPIDRVATVAAIPRNSLGKIERSRLKPLFQD